MQEAPKTEAPKTEVSEMQPFDGIEKPVQQKEATQKEATQKEGFFQKTKNFFNGLKEANDKGYAPDKEQEKAGTLGKIAGFFLGKGTIEDWNNGRKLTAVGKTLVTIAAVALLCVAAAPLGPIGAVLGIMVGTTAVKKIGSVGKNRNERTAKKIGKSTKAALDKFPEKKAALEKEIKPHEEEKTKAIQGSKKFGALSIAAIVLAVVFPPAGLIALAAAAFAGTAAILKGKTALEANNKIKSAKATAYNDPAVQKAAEGHFISTATDRQFAIAEKELNEGNLTSVKQKLEGSSFMKKITDGLQSSPTQKEIDQRKEVLQSKGQAL